jgi:hypothetical protein
MNGWDARKKQRRTTMREAEAEAVEEAEEAEAEAELEMEGSLQAVARRL